MIPPVTDDPAPPPSGSLLRPLGDSGAPRPRDRRGFLYLVFIALVLVAFIVLAVSFL